MKIIEDIENSLFNRKEVKVIVEAEKNPGFEEMTKFVSENFKIKEELITVKEIKGKFGRNTFLISAFLYKNKEDKEKIDKAKKAGKAEAAKQEPVKAEAAKPAEKAGEKK